MNLHKFASYAIISLVLFVKFVELFRKAAIPARQATSSLITSLIILAAGGIAVGKTKGS